MFGKLLPIFSLLMLLIPYTVQADPTTEFCLANPQGAGCHAGLPVAEYQLLLDQMITQLQPAVTRLETDADEVYKYAFRQLNRDATPLYSAPNGASIGSVAGGAKFVTTMGYQTGWVMIQPNEWVKESDTTIVQPSTFAGILLDENSLNPFTLAWVLLPEYPAPYPNAEPDRTRPRLERYTLVTIYAEAEVDGWRWYLVAPDTWIKQTSIGKIVLTPRPEGVKGFWVAGDLYEQVLVAYENDTPVFATLMSSGRPQYSSRLGTFQTWLRLDADQMSGAAGRDDFYNVDYVPWVLYYDDDFAIHAVYWHDKFGYRASRGCLGLTLTDAKWLYNWSAENGYDQPWVHVFASGDYSGE